MDSPGTKVPLVPDDGRQVPRELQPLHDYYEQWNQEMCGTWSNLVREKVMEIWGLNPSLKISRCIVFGLGSLDIEMQHQHLSRDTRFETLTEEPEQGSTYPIVVKQFIFIRMTMDYIKAAAHPIKTYFQDPLFTELDKAYLAYYGYEVLEGDSGVDMVHSTTLMFNMKCDFKSAQWPTLLKTPPPVYAGLSLEVIIEAWIAEQKRNLRSDIHDPDTSDDFDSKGMEDYMKITNTYSFPTSVRLE